VALGSFFGFLDESSILRDMSNHLVLPAARPSSFGHAAEVRGSGIFGVVRRGGRRPEIFFLSANICPDVLDGVGSGFVDGVERRMGASLGSAVERAFESADGTGDGGVDVGEGGRR